MTGIGAGEGSAVPEGEGAGELERLGDLLGLRDMRTTLAPAREGEDGGQVLEVVNPHPAARSQAGSGVRIWYTAGRFWWHGGEVLGNGADLGRVVDIVSTALQWSRQSLSFSLDPAADPGGT